MKNPFVRLVASIVLVITSLNAGVPDILPTANMEELKKHSLANAEKGAGYLSTSRSAEPDNGEAWTSFPINGKGSAKKIIDAFAAMDLVIGVVDVEVPVYLQGRVYDAKGRLSWRATTELAVVPGDTGYVFNTNRLNFNFVYQPVLIDVGEKIRRVNIHELGEDGELEWVDSVDFESDSKETAFYFDPDWVGKYVTVVTGDNYDVHFFGPNGNRRESTDVSIKPDSSFDNTLTFVQENIHLGIKTSNGFGQVPIVELTVTEKAEFDIRAETSEREFPERLIVKTYDESLGCLVVVYDVPTEGGRALVELWPQEDGSDVYYVEWVWKYLDPSPKG